MYIEELLLFTLVKTLQVIMWLQLLLVRKKSNRDSVGMDIPIQLNRKKGRPKKTMVKQTLTKKLQLRTKDTQASSLKLYTQMIKVSRKTRLQKEKISTKTTKFDQKRQFFQKLTSLDERLPGEQLNLASSTLNTLCNFLQFFYSINRKNYQ